MSAHPGTRSRHRMLSTSVMGALVLIVGATACASRGAKEPDAPAPEESPPARPTHVSRPTENAGTSTVSAVTGEEMSNAAAQRIEDYLNGRVPGLQVLRDETGRYSIRIRGASGFGRSNEEPLVIIDGMPVAQGGNSEALRVLDPREVSRVEVLKDASQTAMYGSRGANGVLLIRTRGPANPE